jgi:DNA-directed RNA polymerase specialized sigma subunit
MENDELNFRDLFSTETLESIEGVETFIEVEKHIEKWPMREKQILYLMACGHTQEEIGEMVGLSHQHISRILSKMSKNHLETP